ncbi:hypothetical protein ACVTKC_003550 [Citrobacter freundii]|uniref:hypothetical protein n=1 Tax=Citrobacter TaxID=544 RepID=UPI002019EDD0|nr:MULTISPECIES: hypothetical protein [Citrobacter]MDM3259020.1 hypothetical protein [Citrobacter sp. Cf062]MDQ9465273.1 hypothetical protein [Citrobacter freundii]MEB1014918.1 hypothetical protein [Citrobacter freundii]UQQ27157.1 hypothetical protein LY266_07200 [Citrobacter freundii]HDS5416981.1 hypothetical protein [Citrobacter freundii]
MGSNIIELAKLGHERTAELKASCGAVDVRSLAQLISDLATQLEVQLVRGNAQAVQLANAESKCRELASENAALKEVVSGVNSELYGQGFEVSGWHLNGALEPLDNWFTDNGWGMPETPATDAFMAEVRAQGVEMAMEHMQSSGSLTFGDCYISLNEFAAQLRKGSAL